MIISKCILTSVMNLNLLDIKSLKKKFNMQKKKFHENAKLKIDQNYFFQFEFL